MASRLVWQRSANRYFVQQDAKSAPKLACRPSTSSLSSNSHTKQANNRDGFPTLDDKSSYCNLSPDSKWWVQTQPDFMYLRGLVGEQVNTLETRNSNQFDKNQDDFASFVTKKSNNFVDKYDGIPKPMHMGSFAKPQMTICNQNGIPQVEVLNVTIKPNCEIDSSKSKILEALCHSQTRARKAENAAKEAYAEKDFVIKLLFKQTSELFAYRHWVHLLQLENLCYQTKDKNSMSHAIPSKNGKLHKNLKVPLAKGKTTRTGLVVGRHEHSIGKYAVVFVVGLGIVGAGLLLGWTVGWMLL